MNKQPSPISPKENRLRLQRICKISVDLGFTGSVEYRHAYSRSGGGQYCIGPDAESDIMIVYAEAFERDADPDDYSLDAIIAHECGHQRLHRIPELQSIMEQFPGEAFEEILASFVGSLLLGEAESAWMLLVRAKSELGDLGLPSDVCAELTLKLMRHLEVYL